MASNKPTGALQTAFNVLAWQLKTTCYLDMPNRAPERQDRAGKADALMYIPVRVLQHKSAFGRIKALVTPVGGAGKQWVAVERILKELPF